MPHRVISHLNVIYAKPVEIEERKEVEFNKFGFAFIDTLRLGQR